jgi:hypothetical protein
MNVVAMNVGPRKRRFRPAQSHSPTVEACSAAVRLLFGCYSAAIRLLQLDERWAFEQSANDAYRAGVL